MNPTAEHHRPPPPPHRPSSSSCDLHPTEKFNNFCPSCLYDKLKILNPSSSSSSATSSSLFRRTKSFSASKGIELNSSALDDPHRRSCDVGSNSRVLVLNNNARGEIENISVDKRGPVTDRSCDVVSSDRVLDNDNCNNARGGIEEKCRDLTRPINDPKRRFCDIVSLGRVLDNGNDNAGGGIEEKCGDLRGLVNDPKRRVCDMGRVLDIGNVGGGIEENFGDLRGLINDPKRRVCDVDCRGGVLGNDDAGFRVLINDSKRRVCNGQDSIIGVEDEVGRGRVLSNDNAGGEIRGIDRIRVKVMNKDEIGGIEGGFEGIRVENEVGRCRNLDSCEVEDENMSIEEKIGDKKVGNFERSWFEGEIRVKVPMEEKSRVIMLPIETGRAKTLAQSVCEEIKAFDGKMRVRVPSEEERAKTLAQSVCDEIRGFKGKVRVPIDDQVLSNEEQSRVKKFPVEAGKARSLGRIVADKIKVFEEQISPTEVKPRVNVKVPIQVCRAQTPVNDSSSEIRPFEEKLRVKVPIEAGKARVVVGDEIRSQTEVGARVSEFHSVGDEIRVLEEQVSPIEEQSRVRLPNEVGRAQTVAHMGDKIRAFDEEIAVDENVKSMRHYIDLDFQAKKKKSAVGFWSAASVFSKKWNKWMKKQKDKKQNSGSGKTVLPLEKPTPWKYHRETQSEVADYGMGRRSCDTEPRFSIDVGRLSVDGPRPSFEPPRASWDGHMIRRNIYSDHRVPGDTIQTHQYYLDTSSRRRRSFDRSKNSNLVNGDEVDEMKLGSNAKVTPETFDFHQRKSNSNTLRDECSEIFELGIRDDGSVFGNIEGNGSKRSGRWGKKWSFWGLIYKRDKNNEDERSSRGNNGNIRCGTNGNMYRRSSSVSLATPYNLKGLSGSVRNKSVGESGHVRKNRDDLTLERNRSVDNGLLRFYLTPPRGKNRVFGSRKSIGTDNLRSTPKGAYRY